MNYFVNKDTGSYIETVAESAPAGFSRVTVVEFNDFVKQQDQKRVDAFAEKAAISQKKVNGFDYNGTMYSATKEDQNGLMAVFTAINNSLIGEAKFVFSNGAKITLNAQNLQDFAQKWSAFRQTFFS